MAAVVFAACAQENKWALSILMYRGGGQPSGWEWAGSRLQESERVGVSLEDALGGHRLKLFVLVEDLVDRRWRHVRRRRWRGRWRRQRRPAGRPVAFKE